MFGNYFVEGIVRIRTTKKRSSVESELSFVLVILGLLDVYLCDLLTLYAKIKRSLN